MGNDSKKTTIKHTKGFLKRSLALLMAVAMITTSDMGVLQRVFAQDITQEEVPQTDGNNDGGEPIVEPVGEQKNAQEPVTEPVVEEPVAQEPVVEEPEVEEPVVDPAAEENTLEEPTSESKVETMNLSGNIVYMGSGTYTTEQTQIQLFANGTRVTDASVQITEASTSYNGYGYTTYTYLYENLPKTTKDGSQITYTIKDANYDPLNIENATALFYIDSNNQVMATDSNQCCAAGSTNLVYVARNDVQGCFNVATNGQELPQESAIQMTISTENDSDTTYINHAEDAVVTIGTDSEDNIPGMPVAGTWKVSHCLEYNPVTGTAITYRAQVTGGVDGYITEYDNGTVSGKESDTSYAYAGGNILYTYVGEEAYGTDTQATDVTISGQIHWDENTTWTDLVRPTQLPSNVETYLNLYSYTGDTAEGGTKINLQGTDPSAPNYIEWKMTEGIPYWNYTIKNVSQGEETSFYVMGPKAGAYQATATATASVTSDSEIKMNYVEYNKLNYGTVTFQKVVVPASDNNTFSFTVTAGAKGAAADAITTNYSGAYTVDTATATTSNGKITGIHGGDTVTLTEFPVGLSYKVVESTSDDYITTYENQTGIAGQGTTTTVKNVKNNATAEMIKAWNDNNSLTRSESDFRAALYLEYSTDDGTSYTEVTSAVQEALGIGAITYDVAKDNYSEWSVKALNAGKSNFPAVTEDGQAITYKISERPMDGYIASESVDDQGKPILMNTKTMDFSAKLDWKDTSAKNQRPERVHMEMSGYYINGNGNTVYLETNDWAEMGVDPTINISCDKEASSFDITKYNLPMYTKDGNLITYFVKERDVTGYEVGYDNGTGSHGSNFTECYQEGTITNTVVGTVEYAATKVWADDADDAQTRPTATMYLYRYSAGGDMDSASPVVIVDVNKENHVLSYVIPSDSTKKVFPFGFASQLEGITVDDKGTTATLDQYDEEGRAYTYFVKEVLSGDNSTLYAKSYANTSAPSVIKGALNGGIVTNTRIETIQTQVQKSWKTASYPDVPKDTTVTYLIQNRAAGTEEPWSVALNDAGNSYEVTLGGFSAEVLTKEQTLQLPKYDENGNVLEYQLVEEKVTKAGTDYTVVDGKVTIEGHDYEFVSSPVSMADATEDESGEKWVTLSGENRLVGTVDYTVVKKWEPEPTTDQGNYTATVKLVRYLYDGSVDGDFQSEEYTLNYSDIVGSNHWAQVIKDLPKYDADGYQYSYKAVEIGCTPDTVPGTDKAWEANYSYDGDHYKTTIKNAEPGEGTEIKVNKVWKDDGDVQHRKPVVVGLYNEDGVLFEGKTVTLTEQNEWTNYISISKEETEREENPINLATCQVKEISVDENVVSYTGEVEGYTATEDLGIVLTDEKDGHIYGVINTKNNDGSWTVTNVRKGKLSITVEKNWVDGNRLDKDRPTISFLLKRNEEEFQQVADLKNDPNTDRHDNTWTYEFENLEKYDENGVLYSYKVDEIVGEELKNDDYVSTTREGDYDISNSTYHSGDTKTYTVTNTRQGVTDYTVYKKWKDLSTTTRRPDIYVRLYYQVGDGNIYYEYGQGPDAQHQTRELDYIWTGGDGSDYDSYCHIANLNKYTDDGQLISYFTKEFINVRGEYQTYYWEDQNLNTATSHNDAGYAGDEEYIENRLKSTLTVNGVKIWKNLQVGTDAKDIDSNKITISLYRAIGDENPILVATQNGLNKDNTSFQFTKATVTNTAEGIKEGDLLQKYDENGQLYTYTLSEALAGNMEIIYAPDPNGFQMTNTFVTGEANQRTIRVSKTWDASAYTDAIEANQATPVYPDITFKLYRSSGKSETENAIDYNAAPIATLTVSTVSGQTMATGMFDKQLVWSENGIQYQYAVKEVLEKIPGYTNNLENHIYLIDDEGNTFTKNYKPEVTATFTNVYNPVPSFQLTGTKKWNDANKADLRPENVTLEVYRYTAKMGSETIALRRDTDYTITWDKLANKDKWTYTISGAAITKYAPDGQPWIYKIVEKDVDSNYTAENDGVATMRVGRATLDLADMNDLTNSLKSSYTVTKTWEDNNNEYGMRPTFSYVKLQRKAGASGNWEDVTTYTNSSDLINYKGVPVIKLSYSQNKWSYTFQYLAPADKNGNAYTYRSVEVAVGIDASGDNQEIVYTTSGDRDTEADMKAGPYTVTYNESDTTKSAITNTLIPTSLTVIKKWEDHSNQYDSRPKNANNTPEITVTLQYTTTPNDDASWTDVTDTSGKVVTRKLSGSADTLTHTFDNLPSCKYSGETYYYRAVENVNALVESYTPSYNYNYTDGTTEITNALIEVAENADVTATKVWRDGNKPSHTAMFELLRYVDNQLVTYPERKLVTLDGTADSDEGQTSGEFAAWVATWKNLPKNTNDGKEIVYKVKEASINNTSADNMPANYDVKTEQQSGTNHWTITNTELTSYIVTKQFTNDTYNVRPKQLYVQLERSTDGGTTWTAVAGDYSNSTTPNTASTGGIYHWTGSAVTNELPASLSYTFNHLPKFDESNRLYSYRVRETKVVFSAANGGGTYPIADNTTMISGYDITNVDNNIGTQTDITNTMETVNLTGTKIWADTINGVDYSSLMRPENLTLVVYKETGTAKTLVKVSKQPPISWVKGDNGTWTFTFSDLPLYNPDNTVIQYHVKEDTVPTGYTVSNNDLSATFTAADEGKTITVANNSEGIKNTLITKKVTGTKTWVDTVNGQPFDIQPESIALTLYQSVDGKTPTVTTTHPEPTWVKNGGTWTYTYEGLPSVDKNGKDITYSVVETVVPGYTKKETSTSTGTNITNTLDTVTLTATKTWDDQNNNYGTRPSGWNTDGREGLYTVYADGVVMNPQPTKTWTQGADSNHWNFTVSNLQKYKLDNGEAKEIVYTVQEDTMPVGYTQQQSGNAITNTLTTVSISGNKIWDDETNIAGKRPENISLKVQSKIGVDGTWADMSVQPTASWSNKDSERWTYTYSGLPRYNTSSPQTEMYYRVVETDIPTGYTSDQRDGAEGTRDTASGNVTEATITNTYASGSIQIAKVFGEGTSNTTHPIATFTIKKDGAVVGKIKTNESGTFSVNADGSYTDVRDESGKTTFKLMEDVAYTIQETATEKPGQYEIDNKEYTFTLTKNATSYTVENDAANHVFRNAAKRGTLKVTKLDEKFDINENGTLVPKTDQGTKLDGADFIVVLTDEAGNATKKMITHLVKKGATTGEYILPTTADTTAVDGYQVVSVNEEGVSYLMNDSGNGTLLYGNYKIVEVKAPTGYDIKNAETSITVGDEESAAIVDVPNSMIQKPFSIKKQYEQVADIISDDGTMAAANDTDKKFSFTVTRTKDSDPVFDYSVTVDTNANGVAVFDTNTIGELPYGTYTVTETATDAYVTPSIQNITVDADGVHYDDAVLMNGVLEVENLLKRGSVQGMKVDGTNSTKEHIVPVKGATMGLFDNDAGIGEPLLTAVTGEEGKYQFEEIPYGVYYVKETEAPYGYKLSDQIEEVTVSSTDTPAKVADIRDEMYLGSITLIKKDADDKSTLKGAEFQLKNSAGEVVDTQTTDANGQLVFENLHMETYKVVESKAPQGYVLSKDVTEVTLSPGSDTQNVTVERTNIKTEFSFSKSLKYFEDCYKADETTKVAGVEFSLYADETCGTEAVGQAVSDADGKVTFIKIPTGIWYMKETAVPKTFIKLDSTIYKVQINEDGSTTIDGQTAEDVTIVNDVIRGDIAIKKVNEDNHSETIANSTYGLYRELSDDEVLEKSTGDTATQTINVFGAAKPVATDIILMSTRDSQAAAELPTANEVLVATATTDQTGMLKFSGVLTGVKYIIRELVAPDGSEISENPIQLEFDVDADGNAEINPDTFNMGDGTASIDEDGNITWYEPDTKAMFYKKDEDGKLLAGARMTILNEDGTPVQGIDEWISSSEEGHLIKGVLVSGKTYILKEISAPSGYEIAEPITFTMSTKKVGPNENFVQEWTMIDKKIPQKPADNKKTPLKPSAKTGDQMTVLPYILLAVVALAVVVGVIVFRKKKKHKNEE